MYMYMYKYAIIYASKTARIPLQPQASAAPPAMCRASELAPPPARATSVYVLLYCVSCMKVQILTHLRP